MGRMDIMTQELTQRRIRKLTIALAGIGVALFLIWLVGYATGPAQEVARIRINGPDGERHELILLQAEPIIHVPMFYTSVRFVQFGNSRKRLHGASFGNHPGPILVSPNRTQVIATRRFKGSTFGGIRIDLATGKMAQTERGREEEETADWEHLAWFGRDDSGR